MKEIQMRTKLNIKTLAIALLLIGTTTAAADSPLLQDDFDSQKRPGRKMMRGDWQVNEGVLSCPFDEERYKKARNHGPIVFYNLKHDDAVVSFSFKASDPSAITYTTNAVKRHCFRMVLKPGEYGVRAFPIQGKRKSVLVDEGETTLTGNGQWTQASFASKGDKVTVKIGDEFEKTFEHPAYEGQKTNISIAFNHGTFSLKDFKVEAN